MRHLSRLTLVAPAVAAALALGACAGDPVPPATVAGYPSAYPPASYPAAGTEWGRVTNIEYIPVGASTPNNNNVLGAVVGGLAGAVLGHQIGGGSGRDVATVLGGVAGAAVGNRIARNQQGVTTATGYRITVQTDQGAWRTYEVSATGDLRVGDRVRVENGVIYRA